MPSKIKSHFLLLILLGILAVKYSYGNNLNEICKKVSQTGRSNLKQQKNLLRKYADTCQISSNIFLKYANAQLLERSYWESLWAAKRSQINYNRKKNISKYYQSKRIQALSYIGLHREEEAIQLIKNEIFEKNNKAIIQQIPIEHQKLFLVLIQAYFRKHNNVQNKNIQYLLNKFKTTFPDSVFHSSLKQWIQSNKK